MEDVKQQKNSRFKTYIRLSLQSISTVFILSLIACSSAYKAPDLGGLYNSLVQNESPYRNPPYMFKTDSYGNGRYETHLSELPFGKWAVLMIVLHPNGDPTDMKNMVGALSTKIPENG